MSTQRAFRFRNPALLIALAAVYPVLAYSAGAGSIDFSAGSVTAVNVAGVQRPLTKGAEISSGDTIRTGDGGRAQVRFTDGAMISLQPQTEFRVDNYQYADKSDGQEKGFFSLLKGGMRAVTGLIGRSNRDAYKVTTSVATIGIRGTEYTGTLDPATGDLGVHTGEGLVEVCNGAGCVLLASGESGTVSGGGSPRRTDSRPQLPPTQPSGSSKETFSSSENRNPDGSLGGIVLTGTQKYTTAWATTTGSLYGTGSGTGTIDSSGALTNFISSTSCEGVCSVDANVAAGNSVQNYGNDGIVAWGRWIDSAGFSGTDSNLTGGGKGVLHYVTGIPTTDSQAALGGLSGTYTLLGGGVTGSNNSNATSNSVTSASMTVDFAAATPKVTALSVGMTVGASSYSLTGSNMSITDFGVAPVFSGSGTVTGSGCVGGSGCTSAEVNGAFFGAGAARAGVAFKFTDAMSQNIAGAVALKK